jgi:hypothetical protein
VKTLKTWLKRKGRLIESGLASYGDAPVGRREGLHEARALKDYRSQNSKSQRRCDKAA